MDKIKNVLKITFLLIFVIIIHTLFGLQVALSFMPNYSGLGASLMVASLAAMGLMGGAIVGIIFASLYLFFYIKNKPIKKLIIVNVAVVSIPFIIIIILGLVRDIEDSIERSNIKKEEGQLQEAISSDDTSKCEIIKEKETISKIRCYQHFAKIRKDPEICLKIPSEKQPSRDFCFRCVLKNTETIDPAEYEGKSYQSLYVDEYERRLKKEIALETKDYELCIEVGCVDELMELYNNKEFCLKRYPKYQYSTLLCFRDIGFENATEEDCNGFITKIDYESAYIKCIAKVRNEPTLCKDNVDMDFRSTEEMIFDCLKEFDPSNVTDEDCKQLFSDESMLNSCLRKNWIIKPSSDSSKAFITDACNSI